MFELENALKKCNVANENLKTQFEALEQKVKDLSPASEKEKMQSKNENECEKCDVKLNSKHELENHMNDKHLSLKCRKCEITAESKTELKRHIKEKHVVEVKCKICEKVFTKNSDLELHLKNLHKEKENHKCRECGQDFVLKWRLKKHMNIHESSEIKGCHYFNNEKTCPYENLGCMFSHRMSGQCQYGKLCRNKLCSFQHKIQSEEDLSCQECEDIFPNEDALKKHVESEHEDENNDEDEFHPCDSCEKVFNDIEDLIEHYGETAHND